MDIMATLYSAPDDGHRGEPGPLPQAMPIPDRNTRRAPYEHLVPTGIPQSINI